mgnify:CR=1 FL=1
MGGVVAALVVLQVGPGGRTGDVTINQAPAPRVSVVSSGRGSASSIAAMVYHRDGPGVVSIDVVSGSGTAGGSGFVLDKNGHIITNQHVVEGAKDISVEFASGMRRSAEVVGSDPSTDIALLKVDAPKSMLKPLTLGDSSAVKVGDPVVAIGNPLNVGISVTSGIISGLDRSIRAPNNYTISGALQTDAPINPGNSGGPLIDASGNVIGVNAQIATETGSYEGIGFAIPIDTVKSVVEQLVTKGQVRHGYLGVKMYGLGIGEISAYTGMSAQRLSERYGLPDHGAIVAGVTKDGPAQRAGIRGAGKKRVNVGGIPVPLGDVITSVDGRRVSGPDGVISAVNAGKPGDRLRLEVVTPGKAPREVTVRLGVQPGRTSSH